ncbi:MAG TPA: C-terminal binding protein [Chloroflexota bacterium]
MTERRPLRALVARADFPDLDAERRILAAVGAEVVDGRFMPEAELVALCREADAVMTDYFVLRRPLIEAMTRCRVICQYGVGLDQVDLGAATERGIVVTHTPTACTDEVADHALALLLCLWRKIVPLRDAARAGGWDYNLAGTVLRIRGRVLGLVGLGRIGRGLAARAAALGFSVVAHDPLVTAEEARALGVEPCDLATLLARADAVSLHAPLTPATHHLIGARELGLMKPTALLVNTSRGGLVDQAALVAALERGQLAGAALDVLEREPPGPDEPLLRRPDVIVTPHAAFYSRESLAAVQTEAAEAVAAVLGGRRPRVVANPAVLEGSG